MQKAFGQLMALVSRKNEERKLSPAVVPLAAKMWRFKYSAVGVVLAESHKQFL